jgi:hypothetical protein
MTAAETKPALKLKLQAALQLLAQAGHALPADAAQGSAPWLQAVIDGLCTLSSRDALTGLSNRRQFELALAREVDRVKTGARPRFAEPPPKAAPAVRRTTDAAVDPRTRALEASFLQVLVAHPELLAEGAGRLLPTWFRDPACAALLRALLGPPVRDPGAVLADPELAPEVRMLLSGLLANALPLASPLAALNDGIDAFTRRALQAEQKELQDELRRAEGDAARTISARIHETARALRALAPAERRKETA